jgi:hypothetical protein
VATTSTRAVRAAAWACALALTGCAGGNGPYPVSGVIVYEDGAAVTGLEGIAFRSADGKAFSVGRVDQLGRFKLSYVGQDDGALLGTYVVSLSPPELLIDSDAGRPPAAAPVAPPSPVPPEYTDPEKSPLTATVESRWSNQLTLTVPRPKPATTRRGR